MKKKRLSSKQQKIQPTTREIAALCGVSQATVSMALRGHPSISEKRQKQVRKNAEKLGWKPNPLANAYMAHLRSTKKQTQQLSLAFFTDHAPTGGLHIEFQNSLLSGARERANELGYGIDVFDFFAEKYSVKKLHNVLKARNIPGVIVTGFPQTSATLEQFDFSQFSLAAHGFALPSLPFHRIHFNYLTGVQMALQKCREKGYSRIGLITSEELNKIWGNMILTAWNHDLASRPKSLRIPPLMPHSAHRQKTATWLKRYKPDVVIGTNQQQMQILESRGYNIPEDFAYCGLSYIRKHPQTAGIERRFSLAGRLLVEQVVTRIHHNERGFAKTPITVSFEGEWKEGASLPDLGG